MTMRRTAWVMLLLIVLTGWVLPAAGHDECADAQPECDGLMCAMSAHSRLVDITTEAPFESIAHSQIPAAELTPLEAPPKSVRLSS